MAVIENAVRSAANGGVLLTNLAELKVGHPYKKHLNAPLGNGSEHLFLDSYFSDCAC